VDHPSTQADKRARLEASGVATGHITFVPVDLTADDLEAALGGAGHDRAERSVFLVEGLLGYLTREDSSKLLSTLGALCVPGSRLAVAFPIVPRASTVSEKVHLKVRSMVVSAIGEPWLVRFEADEPDAVLEASGWEVAPSDRSPTGRARFEGRQGVLIGARRPGSGPVPTLDAR
jgi:methyltransferase (TIGR00027 family)